MKLSLKSIVCASRVAIQLFTLDRSLKVLAAGSTLVVCFGGVARVAVAGVGVESLVGLDHIGSDPPVGVPIDPTRFDLQTVSDSDLRLAAGYVVPIPGDDPLDDESISRARLVLGTLRGYKMPRVPRPSVKNLEFACAAVIGVSEPQAAWIDENFTLQFDDVAAKRFAELRPRAYRLLEFARHKFDGTLQRKDARSGGRAYAEFGTITLAIGADIEAILLASDEVLSGSQLDRLRLAARAVREQFEQEILRSPVMGANVVPTIEFASAVDRMGLSPAGIDSVWLQFSQMQAERDVLLDRLRRSWQQMVRDVIEIEALARVSADLLPHEPAVRQTRIREWADIQIELRKLNIKQTESVAARLPAGMQEDLLSSMWKRITPDIEDRISLSVHVRELQRQFEDQGVGESLPTYDEWVSRRRASMVSQTALREAYLTASDAFYRTFAMSAERARQHRIDILNVAVDHVSNLELELIAFRELVVSSAAFESSLDELDRELDRVSKTSELLQSTDEKFDVPWLTAIPF
ncbi:MAG: hypothetical protein AB8G96_08340 [Phycisphaerales bacterium]